MSKGLLGRAYEAMDIQKYYDDYLIRLQNTPAPKVIRDRLEDNNFSTLFKQYDLAVMPHPAPKQVPLHSHSFFEFIYVNRGTCTNIVDSIEIPLKEGDLCLLNTNAIHTIEVDDPQYDTIFNILVRRSMFESAHFMLLSHNNFVEDFFLKSFQDWEKHKNYIVFHGDEEANQYQEFVKQIIAEFYEDKIYKEAQIIHLFDSLIVELIRNYKERIDSEITKETGKQNLSEIIEYISQHSSSISIANLAKHFNYHPNYLSKIIKKHTGSSFSEILLDIRLRQAKDLLIDSDLPLSDIIRQVGYSNRTWFDKLFCDRFGMTPGEYRHKSQKGFSEFGVPTSGKST